MTEEDCLSRCKGCQERLDRNCDVIQAVNADWHPSCFKCSSCQCQLSSWYIQRAGHLLCRKDYWVKYRRLCNGCSLVTSGPVMVAGEHRYHPECFQCSQCRVCIGQDEPYVLVERSKLHCGQCYESNVTSSSESHSLAGTVTSLPLQPATSSQSTVTLTVTSPMTNLDVRDTTKPRRRPHSIHMVKLPPSLKENHHHHNNLQNHQQNQAKHPPDNTEEGDTDNNLDCHTDQQNASPKCGLRLSILKPYNNSTDSGGSRNSFSFYEGSYRHSFILEGGRMGPTTRIAHLNASQEDLQALRKGDCILEVNGSSMRDRSLDEICDAICNRPTALNMVVERDPNPLPVPAREPDTLASPTSPTSPKEGATVIIDNTPVRLRNKGTLRARGHSPNRRRSKSPSPCPSGRVKTVDLSRSRSFSSQSMAHRVFRPTDLQIGDVLGQGFFGKAMKAKHKVTGEFMVLKELHNFDDDAQKGFLTEVSMLRNLSHPCVLKFMGVLYRDKKLTLVTEFIDGGTLSDLLLNKSVDLSWVQRLKLVKDISNGMAYLHSNDVIHRDLNSGNCFVRKDHSVVVGDFGLAKIFPRNSYLHLSPVDEKGKGQQVSGRSSKRSRTSRKKRQTVVGNPYWMAPEMIVSKGLYDEKVDVFSYGVIVFETIARVTADPDYLPRSIDLGVNVEAFHRRFCQQTPEPYTMLAMQCSLMEPDKRPSFEEVEDLCEALLLHLEHGTSAPQELKGSTVELYRSTKERLYGKNYRDVDTVEESIRLEREKAEKELAIRNNKQEGGSGERNSSNGENPLDSTLDSITSCDVSKETLDVADLENIENVSVSAISISDPKSAYSEDGYCVRNSNSNSISGDNLLDSTSSVVSNKSSEGREVESISVLSSSDPTNPKLISSNSNPLQSFRICLSDSSSVMSNSAQQIVDTENPKVTHNSNPLPVKGMSQDSLYESTSCDVTTEASTSTSFSSSSSSSLSPFASTNSIVNSNNNNSNNNYEGSDPCKALHDHCVARDYDSNNDLTNQRINNSSAKTLSCVCPSDQNENQPQKQRCNNETFQQITKDTTTTSKTHFPLQPLSPSPHSTHPNSKTVNSPHPPYPHTDTVTVNDPDHSTTNTPVSSQSYFLHLDLVHSNLDENSPHSPTDCENNTSVLERSDSDIQRQISGINQELTPVSNIKNEDTENISIQTSSFSPVLSQSVFNEGLDSSIDKEISSLTINIKNGDSKTNPIQSSSSESSVNLRPSLNIPCDLDNKMTFLTLEGCESPTPHMMCSSRSRQKKARNSMNLDQTSSPNLSPQPKTKLDWDLNTTNSQA